MLMFSMLSVVFDVSERIDKFISKGLSFWEVSSQYYFNFLPWINSLLFPLYALITVIFLHQEWPDKQKLFLCLVPEFLFKRLLKPFLLAGAIFTTIHLIGNHYYVPKSNKVLRDFDNKYIRPGNIKSRDRNIHFLLVLMLALFAILSGADSSGIDFQMEKFEKEKLFKPWKQKPSNGKVNPIFGH